jgi:excisionase family DNA binding protein
MGSWARSKRRRDERARSVEAFSRDETGAYLDKDGLEGDADHLAELERAKRILTSPDQLVHHNPDLVAELSRGKRTVNEPEQLLHHESFATGPEVAQFLRVHPKTIERWRKQLGLPCYRLGGRIRYDLGDVTRWASARREDA